MARLALAVCAALLLLAPAAAQPADVDDLLRAMREASARFDAETAEARAREALARTDALSPDQLVEVHTTLGVLLHGRNEPVEARRQFEAALSLAPAHRLDPVLVSPKTVELFDTVRREMGEAAPERPPAVRYVRVYDPRPGAALRSLAAPGWGQFHKGDRARGWAFAVAGGGLAAGTVAAHAARTSARRRYLDAATPDDAAARYPAYRDWHRARAAFATGAALVWAASVVDALATGGPEPPDAGPEIVATPGGLSLRVRF